MKHTDLARWRLAAGLTHAALARRLGVSLATVGHLLAGRRRPSVTLAARIERETGIPARTWARGEPRRRATATERERRASVERERPAPPPPVEPADDDAPF